MVKKLKLFIFCIFIILINSSVFAAELTANVDQSEIALNEEINLTISLKDASFKDSIPIAAIKENFDIIETRNFSNVEIINGKSSSVNQIIYTLKPKKIGEFIIPSIKQNISEELLSTKDIKITVKKVVTSGSKNNNITIEAKVNKNNLYLEESVICKIKVFTTVELPHFELETVKVENALVKSLGPYKVSEVKHDARHGWMIEFQYLITPSKVGKIIISPQILKGKMSVVQSKGFSGFLGANFGDKNYSSSAVTKPFQLATEEIVLDVMPPVGGISPWLPAKSFALKSKLDTNYFEVGKPFKLSITIDAEGLSKNQLPPIKSENLQGDGYKIYASDTELSENVEPVTIKSTRTEIFTIIPQKAGKITLPKIEFKWWNIETNKEEKAVIESYNVQVFDKGVYLQASGNNSSTENEAEEIKDEKKQVISEIGDTNIINSFVQSILGNVKAHHLLTGLIAFILLIIVFNLSKINAFRKNIFSHTQNKKEKLLDEHNVSEKLIKKANNQNNSNIKLSDITSSAELYKFLQDYANKYWQVPLNSSLQTIFNQASKRNPKISESDYQKLIKQLEGNLYSNEPVNIQLLKKDFARLLKYVGKKDLFNKTKKKKELPDLNPS